MQTKLSTVVLTPTPIFSDLPSGRNRRSLLLILSVASLAWTPGLARADSASLKLELSQTSDALRVSLKNTSAREVAVNKRFSYGMPPAYVELTFDVHNEQGRLLPFLDHQNIRPAQQADWTFLRPNQFVGSDIPLSRIALSYALRPGRYQIKATYVAYDVSNAGTRREIRAQSNSVWVVSKGIP